MKIARFLGNSRDVISEFPAEVRRKVGFQIERVQRGLHPDDWKPMPSVGSGVREIRVRDHAGAYRVIYVASFQSAVYILHAFQKKTQTTPKHDLDLAAAGFREIVGRSNS
jgi:phage-related protein